MRFRAWVMVAGLTGVAFSAEPDQIRKPDVEPAAREALDGIWPTPKLLNLLLQRWADDTCDELELDPDQRPKAREAVVQRWETFLTDSRAQLQPVLNDFLEIRLDREPPTRERVQEWAERARPMFDGIREQISEGTDEFRSLLTPMQRARFEVRALQLNIGLGVADQRLRQWQAGEFDVKDVWDPPGREGRDRRRERRREREKEREKSDADLQAATAAAASKAADPIAAELDGWEKYVLEFARTYDLDGGQRDAASSFLSELRQRALAHRDTHRNEIDGLEARIEAFSGSDTELAELKKQLTRLYGPIDDLFSELKSRVDQIPTAEQRAKVVRKTPQADKEHEPPAEARPSEPIHDEVAPAKPERP